MGLIRNFQKEGHQILAIAPKDPYSEKLEEAGCEYEEVPMQGSGMNPFQDIRTLFQLYRVLSRHKPDIILSYTIKPNIYGSLIGRLLGIPIICNVSGLGTVFLWKGSVRTLATSLYAFAFRFSSWIFFQNEDDQHDFLNQVKVKKRKTSILPGSGVDTEHFSPVKANGDQTVFLMVARLLIEKGVYDYIEAIRILKKHRNKSIFRLVGSLDPDHSRSISEADLDTWQREGLIEYYEHQKDIRPILKDANVVVLPSYREGTPKTLLEAGAMGKAMIATDVPGCRQVVMDGENGFLCKLRNPKDLAAKMKLYLALSDSEKSQMSDFSRKSIVDRYDEKLVIDQYQQKIDDLVKPV